MDVHIVSQRPLRDCAIFSRYGDAVAYMRYVDGPLWYKEVIVHGSDAPTGTAWMVAPSERQINGLYADTNRERAKERRAVARTGPCSWGMLTTLQLR